MAQNQDAMVANLLKLNPKLILSDDCLTIKLPGNEGGVILYSDWQGLQTYLVGRKYQRLLALDGFDWRKHEPYIVSEKNAFGIDVLHCTLTKTRFARDPNVLNQHVTSNDYLL